jgi:3-hydroxyisobutyrate dehydrogenase
MSGDEATRRLGFIGLGRMGMPMCARLIRAGYAVTAFDIRTELRAPVSRAGAEWATSAGAAAAAADVVITMLPGPDEVHDVVTEVAGQMAPGSTWMDMSTASPAVASAIAAAAGARGVRQLDSPVGGGPGAAADGRLLAFVGGAAADLHAQRAVIDVLADRVVHVGAAGAGYTVKLLVNLLWFGQALASAEALTLAAKAGIEFDALREAVGHSAAASGFMARDAVALLQGDDLSSFSLARSCDQLNVVLELGVDLEAPLELGSLVADLHRRALAHYHGDRDGELLGARFVAERAGVDLRR